MSTSGSGKSIPAVLALIPARGGSKGIPGKNILNIQGRPLIAYSIDQGLNSRFVTRTIVSTDDEAIATAAREAGAEIPFMRPAEFAGDLSPDIDVFQHALTWLRDNESYEPELVVHLRPTGPVRKLHLIDRAISLMLETPEADSLRSVSMASQTPYKMWRIENGRARRLLEIDGLTDAQSMPRQLLPDVYWQNGYVDIVRPRTVLQMGSMTGEYVLAYPLNEPIFELDYPEDVPRLEDALDKLAQGEELVPGDTTNSSPRHPV